MRDGGGREGGRVTILTANIFLTVLEESEDRIGRGEAHGTIGSDKDGVERRRW